MQRKILFRPAWDRSNYSDPSKDYGVSDLGIFFVVFEDNKFVSFEISTNWYQPHVMDNRVAAVKRDVYLNKQDFLVMHWIAPYPLDVFYISPTELGDCFEWDNGYSLFGSSIPCYYGYRYEKEENEYWTPDYLYWKLINEGDEPVWKWLEKYFMETFNDEK